MKAIDFVLVLSVVASSQSFLLCTKRVRCRPSFVVVVWGQSSSLSAAGRDDNDADDEQWIDDDVLRVSLQKAKLEKLGAPIMPDVETAARSQGEFLAALGNVTREFDEIKKELGSDGAVKVFLDRIDEEEKAADLLDDDGDNVGAFE